MAAALILSALGVSRADIIDDYLLTKEHFDHHRLMEIVEQHLIDAKVERWQRSWLIPYCTVHEENILAFFDAIEERYGDVGTYLTDALQLSDEDILALRQAYLQ